jgi:anti-sigma-K factor RskA
MNDPLDDDTEDLAGEYVLGTLSAGERRRVELSLPHEPALRAAVAAWEARLLPLTAIAAPTEPSAQVWTRVAASLAGARKAVPAARVLKWWERLSVWRTLAASGFAAAAIMAVVPRLQAPVAAPRYMVVLAAPNSMAPGWIVQVDTEGATSVAADKSLQLWTKGEGWKGPVSLGLVQPGKAVDISLAKLPPLQANQLFEITLEPKSGSPIGRPTGPILYIGRAVQML